MKTDSLQTLYKTHKATALFGRYITNDTIHPLLNALPNICTVHTIGHSVRHKPIYGLTIGTGKKRILMWSQMHGNESTTTKALFDLLNTLCNASAASNSLLEAVTLNIIPILNPDGAEAYTRVNANQVDLNRDAQNLTQPESLVLRHVFNSFKPHFCYNLHGQRTIFSAGKARKSATVSFLSPAEDAACTVTATRKKAMEVIAQMNAMLQDVIPGQVGVYDDAFNLNCVGDTFQSEHVPTILFEAGHFEGDYDREYTRELIYRSYITSLNYIAAHDVTGAHYKPYYDIPENEKLFFDIIIRNVSGYAANLVDVAIQFKETLQGTSLVFVPVVEKIGVLHDFYGHKEIDAQGETLLDETHKMLAEGNENVIVILKNEKIVLKAK